MAKKKLTDRGILGLPAPAKGQKTYWDTEVPGFGVRVSAGGTKSYVVSYRADGRKRWLTVGRYPSVPLKEARRRARQAQGKVSGGDDPAEVKRDARRRKTFKALAEEYLERHAKPRKKTWKEDQRQIAKDLLPAWGTRKAAAVKRRDVIDLLDEVVDRGAPVQANRLLALTRKIFNFGIRRGLVGVNPCHMVEAPGKEVPRDRVLTKAEIRTLWEALEADPGAVSEVHKLRLVTAQREREVMAMRWEELDLAAGWWTIPAERSKNGLSHRVALSALARELLEHLHHYRDKGSPFVFPSPTVKEKPIRYAQSANRRLREATGLQDFRPHDLRRTAASYMASMGIPRLVIKKILNHVETDVTAVYDRHSYDDEKRMALERWGEKLVEILSEKEAVVVDENDLDRKGPAEVLPFRREARP